jgi:uncharacterized protein (DUF111 family)
MPHTKIFPQIIIIKLNIKNLNGQRYIQFPNSTGIHEIKIKKMILTREIPEIKVKKNKIIKRIEFFEIEIVTVFEFERRVDK